MGPRLSVCVQHHPSRAHLLPRLFNRLGKTDLVTDPNPDGPASAWRSYRVALERTPPGATHRVVIQDDAWPCESFHERAEAFLSEHGDRLVAFYLGGSPATDARHAQSALERGETWVELQRSGWVPTVACAWPVELIPPFLEYAERYEPDNRGDDSVIGAWVRLTKWSAIASVPSLVEHPDTEPSLLGRAHSSGKNRSRIAAVYRDE